MKTKNIDRKINRELKELGIVPQYSEITDNSKLMTSGQRKVLSDWIRLVEDENDREGLDRQLESGLTCTDAQSMLQALLGQMYWK